MKTIAFRAGFAVIGLAFFVAGCTSPQPIDPAELAADVKLAAFYSDNMLFQQNQPIVLKGFASPGGKIELTVNDARVVTTVGDDGYWFAGLPQQPAGGPYTIVIHGRNSITLHNVLVGELWVCSGQSNMVWKAGWCTNAAPDMAAATDPMLRFMTVKCHPVPVTPQVDIEPEGMWVESTPQSAADFSGVGYYFGRQLRRDLNVPVGLINSSVGGTCIEAWMPLDGLTSSPEFQSIAEQSMRMPASDREEDAQAKFYQFMKDWLDRLESTEYKDAVAQGRANAAVTPEQLADWGKIEMPGTFEQNRMPLDGVVWLARTVDVPAEWAGRDLTLSLGVIDDCDTTYFNGRKVGETPITAREHWSIKRSYPIPGDLVHAGVNVIAIRVLDHAYDGGIVGPFQEMALKNGDTAAITLSGTWRYKIEYELDYSKVARRPNPPVADPNNYPSALYNGMISGLTTLPIRGVIWYQGESNSGSEMYRRLFPALITSWRQEWGDPDMPFLFVQLSAFLRHTPETPLPPDYFASLPPGESTWARTREAQADALTLPDTGMAVSIDVGNPIDIHPANKKVVGYRLALVAEDLVYDKNIVSSGPVFDHMEIEGSRIRLFFDSVGTGLVAKDGPLKQFAIAGSDRKFYWAKAELDHGTVVVSAPEVPEPVAVRYAWSNYPDGCNLYNQEGLPAVPFRTDDW